MAANSRMFKIRARLFFRSRIFREGFNWMAGLPVALLITYQQRGLWAILTGGTLDIYRLEQVPTVSHDDRYNAFPDITKKYLEIKTDPQTKAVHYQDLIDLKKDLAARAKVDPIVPSSRLETSLLFLGANGNLETGRVSVANIQAFLLGTPSTIYDVSITVARLRQAKTLGTWE